MTHALDPELAAAYVHELSGDVRGVIVLDLEGRRLGGPEGMEGAAQTLLATLDAPHATLVVPNGIVWVATGDDRIVVAAAGPAAQPGPTALDVATAAGASDPAPDAVEPSEPLKTAASDVIKAT